MSKVIKTKVLKFGSKHQKIILKLVPNKIIKYIEGKVVSGGINDFSRVEEFDNNFNFGINFVGQLKKYSGLSESARIIYRIIKKDNNVSLVNINSVSDNYNDAEIDNDITNKFLYSVNIFHIQPHTFFEMMLADIGIDELKGRYNVAYWLFELEDIPNMWLDSIKYVNEIWTPSTFVTEAFKKVSDVPVYTIPYFIKTEKNNNLKRKDFNIPEKTFAFLIMYDSKSSIERKNPDAAIDAYINAFADREDVCLVLKISNRGEIDNTKLLSKLEKVKNYVFVDDMLPREDLNSLISLCDVYVSLHRSEGFGLILAEAMSLGTVCISTNYSGNTDFMNEDNSCLVDYELVEIGNIEDKYLRNLYTNSKWADPDINQASEYMLKLVNDKIYYKKLQQQAINDIKNNYSLENVSKILNERLKKIEEEIK